jgi:hypothetical protein
MSLKTASEGANQRDSRHITTARLINQMSWHHIAALVNRLTHEGHCEESIVRALTSLYPRYLSLIEETFQTRQDHGFWTDTLHLSDCHTISELKTMTVHAQDGQWMCRYEYPRRAEAVQCDSVDFLVQAAEHATFSVCSESGLIHCVYNPGVVLLRITGDCACVSAERGDVTLLGRSLGDDTGFFLVALKEGEAIRVTNHDGTQSMVYLFMDDLVNELDLEHWYNNFLPYLAPLD